MRRVEAVLISLGCVSCVTQSARVPDADAVHLRCGADSEQWIRMEAPPANRKQLLGLDAGGATAGEELLKVQPSREVWFRARSAMSGTSNSTHLACAYAPRPCDPAPSMISVEYELVQGKARVHEVLMEVCVN